MSSGVLSGSALKVGCATSPNEAAGCAAPSVESHSLQGFDEKHVWPSLRPCAPQCCAGRLALVSGSRHISQLWPQLGFGPGENGLQAASNSEPVMKRSMMFCRLRSAAEQACRLCSTACRMLDTGQQNMFVADDLEEESGEGLSSDLMCPLPVALPAALEAPLVLGLLVLVHPAGVIVHPLLVDAPACGSCR